MTKKEFYEKIAGKKVIIDNLKEIEKLRNNQIKEVLVWWYNQGFFKKNEIKKTKIYYTIENGYINLYSYLKTKNRSLNIANNMIYYDKMINIFKRNLSTEVKSKDIIINNCYYAKKDIIVLNENTFKTINNEIIYKILE